MVEGIVKANSHDKNFIIFGLPIGQITEPRGLGDIKPISMVFQIDYMYRQTNKFTKLYYHARKHKIPQQSSISFCYHPVHPARWGLPTPLVAAFVLPAVITGKGSV